MYYFNIKIGMVVKKEFIPATTFTYYLGVFIETQFPYVEAHRTAVRCGEKLHDQLSSTKDSNPGAVKINMIFETGAEGFPIDSLGSLIAEHLHSELFTRDKVDLIQWVVAHEGPEPLHKHEVGDHVS